MKIGQLIEYNMRNIFVEKSYPKRAGDMLKIEHVSGSKV